MFGRPKVMKDKNRLAHSNYAAARESYRRRFLFFGPYPYMGNGRDRPTRRPKLYGDNQRIR